MLPSDLKPEQFIGYPPEARKLVTGWVAALPRIQRCRRFGAVINLGELAATYFFLFDRKENYGQTRLFEDDEHRNCRRNTCTRRACGPSSAPRRFRARGAHGSSHQPELEIQQSLCRRRARARIRRLRIRTRRHSAHECPPALAQFRREDLRICLHLSPALQAPARGRWPPRFRRL